MNKSPFKLDVLEARLDRISDPKGQGKQVFTAVFDQAARHAAASADAADRAGVPQHVLAGMAISVKDLFDIQGEKTLAGSRVLSDRPIASQDAAVVTRLRQCGAAIVGKTNMTEFAFSGLGINPHYGTPISPWDTENKRIPGGSSSGAAVSVAEGMAWAAIGTDTGGSCRIPAAFNGIVGMKPTAHTVPSEGALPLSSSYDSVGPLASTVNDCAAVYAAISRTTGSLDGAPTPLRLGVLKNYVLEGLDQAVAQSFEAALRTITASGAIVRDLTLPVLTDMPDILNGGGLVAAEAFQWHRDLLATREAEYDPRVSVRVRRGQNISAADYITLVKLRIEMIARWTREVEKYDAILMPTVPTIAPKIADLHDDAEYGRVNLLMLRNPTIVNVLDGCAISIPCHQPGTAPVGLSIASVAGRDWSLLNVASALERLFQI